MKPERWQQIEKLYHAALKQEPSQRAAFLKEACAGDEALRQEVESLLAYEQPAESFIEALALEMAAPGLAEDQSQPTVLIPRESHSLVGQTVSHYRILEKLGEGGMGVVYKAQDLRLERLVALKFLPPGLSPDQEEKERFIREAKAASALDHPNIGAIYEIADTSDGQMFIVMAYYPGETLKQKIDRGPLPIKEAVDIEIQMAQGLAKAHSQQIVHRDIKPGNMLITKDGLVKIIDFGLAKLGGLTKITKTHTTMGTVAYISPEQARGEEVDQRADVWSLGVVLYEMLTGQVPFPGEHAEAIIHSILTAKPRSLKQFRGDAPVEIERTVHRALQKDLKSRYASAAEVLKDLSEYQSSLTLPKMRLDGWKLISGWIRQKRVAIPGILLLLVLGLLVGWFFNRQAKVRWAREQALPEISRLIGEEKFTAAFALAGETEKYIPTDPMLLKLWASMSDFVSIQSTPSGARIYLKEYKAIDSNWTELGTTPIEKRRLPFGLFRWKVEKKGFATVENVAWVEKTMAFKLDAEGSLPPGMVRITGGLPSETFVSPGFPSLKPIQLQDYWMDKYEVTNKDFKRFVDAGGYQRREYWKEPFVKGGRTLEWEKAMTEFRDGTGRQGPSTWELGDYPKGQDNYPVCGVSWYEAAAYAEFTGKSLPSIYHWNYAAETLWMSSYIVQLSNFGAHGLAPVGKYQGMSSYGTLDMAGNVKEWCWNETDQRKRFILGGGWNDPVYFYNLAQAQSPFDRSATFGFRCVKSLSGDKLPNDSLGPVALSSRNYDKEHPVSQELFHAYQRLYSYDKVALNAATESIEESDENWKKEKVTFNAAYGKERVTAFLFLPKKSVPPYQTLVHFPGMYAIYDRSSKDMILEYIDFIIRGGRAVLWPIYKGTYERGDELKTPYPEMTNFYRDHVICWSKDLGRSIDYLETRPDIDHERIGYYGTSWGGTLGAILPAVENRIKVSVLAYAGFYPEKTLPEVDQINFTSRVTIPVLMINGQYDPFFPVETSQNPMFRLLGASTEHKRHAIFEGEGHSVPRNYLIKETLDWLDRYLGPVKKTVTSDK